MAREAAMLLLAMVQTFCSHFGFVIVVVVVVDSEVAVEAVETRNWQLGRLTTMAMIRFQPDTAV